MYEIARQIGKKHKQIFDVSEIRGGITWSMLVNYAEKLPGINAKTYLSLERFERRPEIA